jgi:hypothetical protein
LRASRRVCNPELVKLLEAERRLAPPAPPDPAQRAPEEQPAAPAPARACRSCGASLAPEQDWCLACGTAASAGAGRRPGWRAVATTLALTLVLVAGAVVASYAALTDKPAPVAPQSPVAQVPATPPPAATQATPPATTAPATSTPSQLPKVSVPSATTRTSTPRTVSPATSTPSSGGTSPTTTGSTTTTKPAATAIALADGAGSVYDPYGRASVTGDPGRALDGKRSTSWYVDPKDPGLQGIGYAIDLGKAQGVKAIELLTTTPGFSVEVYATDEATPPPDILDTRWSHLTNAADVGVLDPKKPKDVKGKERIVLGAGTSKYRVLLLWFTAPPTDAPRLRITELALFG